MPLEENVEESWSVKSRLEKIHTRSYSVEKARLLGNTQDLIVTRQEQEIVFQHHSPAKDEGEFILDQVLLECD